MHIPPNTSKEAFIKDISEGSLRLVNSETKSGWMTADLFINMRDNLLKFSHATLDDPIVLVMNNHVSSCGYYVLNKAEKWCACYHSSTTHF